MAKNDAKSVQHLYERVAQYLQELIDRGTLRPGDKVPSLRVMARRAKVSMATVLTAYAHLERRGVIESRPQSGYYVRVRQRTLAPSRKRLNTRAVPRRVNVHNTVDSVFALAHQSTVVPLGIANPDPELLPVAALSRALKRSVNRNPARIVDYAPTPGLALLRETIALRAFSLGAESAEDVVITTGATEALSIALRATAKPGDIVAVPTVTYFAVLQMIERFGMLAVEVDSDPNDGLNLTALETVLERVNVKVVVNAANFCNPTGSLMTEEKKRRLVDMLGARDIALIEDEVMSELYFQDEAPQSCRIYDTKGLVLSISSLSKTLAPGFRIGWIFPGRYLQEVLMYKQLSTAVSPSVTQRAATEFLREGLMERHLHKLRRAFSDQVHRMAWAVEQYFPQGSLVSVPQGGFVLWVRLAREIDTSLLYPEALARGTSFTPGVLFSASGKHSNCLRLCASQPWSDEIERAVMVLGDLFKQAQEQI